jgi:hypothetical protein
MIRAMRIRLLVEKGERVIGSGRRSRYLPHARLAPVQDDPVEKFLFGKRQ